MDWLHQLWPASKKKPHSIPLPTPVSLHRRDIPALSNLMVGWKQNGIRVVLVCGWVEDVGVFITKLNRKKHVVKTQYFNERDVPVHELDLFAGTLLDCEEMPDGTYTLLDVITCAGHGVFVQPFDHRMQAFANLHTVYRPMLEKYNFFIRPKRWFPNVQEALKRKEACEDGLIFMDRMLPYGYGCDKNLKKWKTEHTIDLEMRRGKWGYMDTNGWVDATTLGIEMRSEEKDGIYECVYEESAWKVKMARPDKRYANFRSTVEDALESMRENITLKDLM